MTSRTSSSSTSRRTTIRASTELGEGLRVSASAPDGVIEAIEAIDGGFCLGVQWHPEERLDPEGITLIRAFIAAARARARAKFAVRS